ncbi:transposase [Halomonas daqiaonensis]|uniref:Transposase n=1 Tax=Halomonas daqiaonensis TaxID=650850 RepID=A0A1H7WJ78_9GAMM|nr:transposase [Halomonas daqiaonensis]SEM21563.1 Transposase [Halomonas daqiaonensis]
MRYPAERKEAILKKMAPPMSMTIPELAEQEGITATTLYNWRKQARARGQVLPSRSTQPDQWTSQEKFQIVLETAPMNEAELSAYCRERGLYPEQVEAWWDACMNANEDAAAQAKQFRQARKAEQKRLCKLELELHRKDKALAETAALLALSKSRGDLGHDQRRGLLTSLPDRQRIVTLVQAAQRDGARLAKACQVMGINVRTY